MTISSLPVAHIDVNKYLQAYRLTQSVPQQAGTRMVLLYTLRYAMKLQWFLSLVYIVGITWVIFDTSCRLHPKANRRTPWDIATDLSDACITLVAWSWRSRIPLALRWLVLRLCIDSVLKLSILAFYRRFLPRKPYLLCLYVVAACTLGLGIATLFVSSCWKSSFLRRHIYSAYSPIIALREPRCCRQEMPPNYCELTLAISVSPLI